VTDSPATRQGTTWTEWVGVGAGIAALVVSFLPWYRVTDELVGPQEAMRLPIRFTVWELNFLAWFPIVLLAAVSVLVLWQRFGRPVQMLTSLWLTLTVLAIVMILLRWVTVPAGIVAGYGLYLGLIVTVVSGLAGFLAFRGQERAAPAA
jgi:hypothetical protein